MTGIELVIVLILIVAIFGAYPGWGWSAGWGNGPFGLLITLLIVLVILRVLHVV